MKYFNITSIILIAITLLQLSCTESYDLKSKNFESLLVVEATITNELKRQEIKLSRTYRLDSVSPIHESNATVWIEDNNQVQYQFSENSPGIYISNIEFQAESSSTYTLNIIASDNQQYQSSTVVMPPVSTLENIVPVSETVNGVEGIQLYVESSNSNAQYFKYDYEETYKIVAPYYNDFNLVITTNEDNEAEFNFIFKEESKKTCYSTDYSHDIIQTSLTGGTNSQVNDFPIHFIDKNDSKLRERYSILIKQYVQSFEAYNFYKILKDLGTSENLFVDNQPGFIQGNITSVDDSNENVIGFFQVSTISSKRIFFNYEDFFAQQPDYFYECIVYENLDYNDATSLDGDRNDRVLLLSLLGGNVPYKYLSGSGPIFAVVNPECGECTTFSSTEIPEFWEE